MLDQAWLGSGLTRTPPYGTESSRGHTIGCNAPRPRQKTASGSNAAERNASAATAFVQHRHGDVEDEQQAKQWWAEALGI